MTDLNQVDIEQGKVEVEVFKKTDAALSALKYKYSEIPDVYTKDGYEFVKNGVKELTGLRTTLDAERQRIKKPYLDAGRIIDHEAKRITAKLVELEEPMKAAKKEVDDRKKKQEAERLARLQEKVNAIYNVTTRARNQSSEQIAKLIDEVDAIDTKRDYYDLTREAIEAQQAVLADLADMYEQQFKYEQAELERKRIEKEQAAEREKQKITDRINDIRMIPTLLMGKSSDNIEREIRNLDNHGIVAEQFGDQVEIAKEARQTAIQQLTVMLKQQRMVEEAQAKQAQEKYDSEMAVGNVQRQEEAEEEPKPAHEPAPKEDLEVTEEEDQAWQEKAAKQPWSGTVTESDREDIKAGDKVSIDDVSPEPNPVNDTPDIWKDLTDWADEHEITAAAFDDLTLIVSRYL